MGLYGVTVLPDWRLWQRNSLEVYFERLGTKQQDGSAKKSFSVFPYTDATILISTILAIMTIMTMSILLIPL